MTLSKFAGVHPYVTARVRYILGVADRHGARYTVTSGRRTQAAQANLWVKQTRLPAAFPGCSSHEYGLAMDVKFRDPRWQNLFQQVARAIGLSTVPSDEVHVQGLPSSVVVPILKNRGLCPSWGYRTLTRGAVGVNEMFCGQGGGVLAFREGGPAVCLRT